MEEAFKIRLTQMESASLRPRQESFYPIGSSNVTGATSAVFILLGCLSGCASSRYRSVANGAVIIPFSYAVTNEAVHRNPFIEATVSGQRTRLLLDTGANGHVLDPELATKLRLSTRPGDVGHDHFGQAVETALVSNVELRAAGWITRPLFVTHSRSASMKKRGILGTLSPQHLLESGVVVLDIPGKTLTLLEKVPDDLRGWLATGFPGRDFVELQRDRSSSEFLVPASLDQKPAGLILLDTGSGVTEFSPKYMGLEPNVRDSSGTLHIGERTLALNRIKISSYLASESMTGILGLDSIGDIVLVFPPGHDKLLLGLRK